MKESFPEIVPSEQETKAYLLSRYIQTRIIDKYSSASEEEEKRIALLYKRKTAKEKADELYQKMIIFRESISGSEENKTINPKLISRIKILFSDPEVQELIPETYGQARVDQKEFRASTLASDWKYLENSLTAKTEKIEGVARRLFQETINGKDDVEEARSEVAELDEDIQDIRNTVKKIETLEGQEKTRDNTDVCALMQYEKFKEYREQLDSGFVWLPSREEIDRKAMQVINSGNPKQTRKGVFFISEPGTGKSEQIRAIASRLTGSSRVKISCGPRTGEPQILGKGGVFPGATKIEQGTFTDFRGTISAAWTGYNYSYQEESVRTSAQVVELDEMPKAFENETFFTTLKGLFSLKDGEKMPGTDKTAMPGRVIIGSGNIGQHHGSTPFPPALEKEFTVIPVDYVEMTPDNPETYEFMVSALMENGAIQANKNELSAGYKKRQLPEEDRRVLKDGSIMVGVEELVKDPTSVEHGFLYRLANAVKAVQNSYMARGGENEYINYADRDLLRYKDGSISIAESDRQIIIGTTITLNDLSGWMIGYKEEKRKKASIGLAEYIQGKLSDKMNEKQLDKDKLRAIFEYFHLFDTTPETHSSKPLTPKEIGYLSPRVPRPLEVEKPKSSSDDSEDVGVVKISFEKRSREALTTDIITFDDDLRLNVLKESIDVGEGGIVSIGNIFVVQGEEFELVGIVADESNSENGKVVGKSVDGYVYKRFDIPVLEKGVIEKFSSVVEKKLLSYGEIIKKLCP